MIQPKNFSPTPKLQPKAKTLVTIVTPKSYRCNRKIYIQKKFSIVTNVTSKGYRCNYER